MPRPRPVQGVVEPCLHHGFRVAPPPLQLGIAQLDDAALREQPPAFLLVLDEGIDRVAGQPILRRHPLRFTVSHSDDPVVEGRHDGTVCLDNQMVGEQIGTRTYWELLLNTIANSTSVPLRGPIQIPPCGSGAIRPNGTCDVGNCSRTLEVAYSYQLSRNTGAHGPDIAIDILCHPEYQPQRLTIRFGDSAETSILEDVQTVINSYPQIPGSIFEHVRDLVAGETLTASNRRDRSVRDLLERAGVCNPDRAISARQDTYRCLPPESLRR